jgi:hypothetical protein
MNIHKFKAEQLSKLITIKQRFSDNARIREIVDLCLVPKLQHLRAMDLAGYIFTLYLASREFPVFEELMPSEQEVEHLVKEKNKLHYLKAKYMSRLMRLRKELKAKYPEKAERVESIIFEIAPKLANLRRHMLTDYLFAVTLACKEFSEFCQLVPSEHEIKTLFVVPHEE